MQMAHNEDFLVGHNNIILLVVKFNFIEQKVGVLSLEDSTTNEDINPFLLTVYLYPKVFFTFRTNIEGLICK